MSNIEIIIEEAARDKILSMMGSEKRNDSGLRIQITSRGSQGYKHAMSFVDVVDLSEDDTTLEIEGIKVFLDPKTKDNITGAKVQFIDDLYGGGFKVENPNQPTWNDPVEQKVQELIDEKVNPSLAMHGGFVDLLEVKDTKVYLNFGGGCQGCGMINVTVKQGVEEILFAEMPQLTEVIDSTDHASGTNPYYTPGK